MSTVEMVLKGPIADLEALLMLLYVFDADEGNGITNVTHTFHGSIRIDLHRIKNLVVDSGEVTFRRDGTIATVVRAPVFDGPHMRVQFFGQNPQSAASLLRDNWDGRLLANTTRQNYDASLRMQTLSNISLYSRRPTFLKHTTIT